MSRGPRTLRPALRPLRDGLLALAAFALGAALLRPFVPPARGGRLGDKLEYFAAHKDEYDAVYFGASRVYRGVDPLPVDAQVERRLADGRPFRSFNFGDDGIWAFEQDELLHHVLALEPARLRWVLYGGRPVGPPPHRVHAFTEDTNLHTHRGVQWHTPRATANVLEGLRRWPAPLRERLDLALVHLKLCARNLTNYGAGRRIAERLLASKETRAGLAWIQERLHEGRGHHGLERRHGRAHAEDLARYVEESGEFAAAIARIPGENALAVDLQTIHLGLYEEQLAAARARGIELLYFLVPGYEGDPERLRLAELGLLPPVWNFNDPERYPELFDPANRYDRGHLNDAGVRALAGHLGEWLSAHVAERVPASPEGRE